MWYFSATDIIGAINDEQDYVKAGNYWRWLKKKLASLGIQPVSATHEFKFQAPDGRYSFYNEQLIKVNDPLSFLKIRMNAASWKKANDPLAFYPCQKCLDVFLDINKPLGVATYQLEEVVERTVKELEQHTKNN